MKNLFLLLMLLSLINCTSIAQYKKTSIFNRNGTIYDIGGLVRLQSGERSNSAGLSLGIGKENNRSGLHYLLRAEIGTGVSYKYNTTDPDNPGSVYTVSGKKSVTYGSSFTLGYYVLPNKADNKLLPFVSASLGFISIPAIGFSSEYSVLPDWGSIARYPAEQVFSFTYGGGAGLLYRFQPRIAMRASVNYTAVSGTNATDNFYAITGHPVAALSLQYRIIED